MNKMIEGADDPEALAAAVLMLSGESGPVVLVVEGETDQAVLAELIHSERCETFDAGGKENVLAIRERLLGRPARALYLIDRDHDHLTGALVVAPDVVVTDENDLDLVLFRSRAFDKVVREMGSQNKVSSLTEKGVDLRDLIMKSALPLAYLRLYSRQESVALKFKCLRFGFVNSKTGEIDIQKLIKAAFDHSKIASKVERDDAAKYISDCLSKEVDPWTYCCGHDVMHLFGVYLQRIIGSATALQTKRDEIEQRMRLAYEAAYFRATSMYQTIRAWEQSHSLQCLR
jgi:hypothetical protein